MQLRSQADDGVRAEATAATITPAGIIDGDASILAELCDRRGRAVLAYCRRVSAPGLGGQACAEAFAEFRRTLAQAVDPDSLDPDAALLRETRYAAAAHAPEFGAATPSVLDRVGRGQCARAPYVIAARESGEMSFRACRRLASHMRRCVACREADARGLAAEREYRDPSIEMLPPEIASAILSALGGALDNEAVAPVPAPAVPLLDADLTPGREPVTAFEASLHAADPDAAWLPQHTFDVAPEEMAAGVAPSGSGWSPEGGAYGSAASPSFRSRRRRRAAPIVLTSLAVAAGGVGLAMAMSSSSPPAATPSAQTSPPLSSAGSDAVGEGQTPTIASEPPAAAKPSHKAKRATGRRRSARAKRAARTRAARRSRTQRATVPARSAQTRVRRPASQPRSVAPSPARAQPTPPPPTSPSTSRRSNPGGTSPAVPSAPAAPSTPVVPSSPTVPGGAFTDEGET